MTHFLQAAWYHVAAWWRSSWGWVALAIPSPLERLMGAIIERRLPLNPVQLFKDLVQLVKKLQVVVPILKKVWTIYKDVQAGSGSAVAADLQAAAASLPWPEVKAALENSEVASLLATGLISVDKWAEAEVARLEAPQPAAPEAAAPAGPSSAAS